MDQTGVQNFRFQVLGTSFITAVRAFESVETFFVFFLLLSPALLFQ